MKQLLFLLLFPCLALAQYQGNANQKITLGEQTTADGLVYRGVASIDTVTATSKITRANKQDTSAYLLLDTITNLLWHYKIGSNAWTQAGGSTLDTATMLLPYYRAGRNTIIQATDVPTLNQNTTGSAATLTTGRTIQTNLASTSAATFNGSANITPGVTGILPIGNGGTGSGTQNFVDLTTTQSIGGTKTFTNAVTGARFNPTANTVAGTGMYAPASQLGFSVSGTNRLTLDASGNMGLNSTNPAAYGGFIIDYAGIGLHTNSSSGASGINLYENGSGRFSIRTLNGVAGLSFFDIFNNEERMRFTATRTIGLGESSPTAVLHLKAGTATASTAPLKFTSGTNLTTAEAGAMEFNGTNLFFSPSTTRHTVNHGLTGSATLDFPSTTTLLSADLTITVTGAADGDVVSLGVPNAAVNANTCYTAWVSSANTVTIRFNNYSALPVNPASGTFKVFVTK